MQQNPSNASSHASELRQMGASEAIKATASLTQQVHRTHMLSVVRLLLHCVVPLMLWQVVHGVHVLMLLAIEVRE